MRTPEDFARDQVRAVARTPLDVERAIQTGLVVGTARRRRARVAATSLLTAAVIAVAVTGAFIVTDNGDGSDDGTIGVAAPPTSPGATAPPTGKVYTDTQLLDASDHILDLSGEGKVPTVSYVQGSDDGRALVVTVAPALHEERGRNSLEETYGRYVPMPVKIDTGPPPTVGGPGDVPGTDSGVGPGPG